MGWTGGVNWQLAIVKPKEEGVGQGWGGSDQERNENYGGRGVNKEVKWVLTMSMIYLLLTLGI